MTKALVVIDFQKGIALDPNYPAHDAEGVADRIAALIAKARAARVPVFYVQHDEGPGSDLHAGKPGFPFHDKVAPAPGDDVTVKHHSSAFHDTDLDAKLRRAGVDHLVVTGMQSEYCVDSAVRGAVERNYKVTLVADGHSTFDTRFAKAADIIAIQNDTMNGSFAKVIPAAEVPF